MDRAAYLDSLLMKVMKKEKTMEIEALLKECQTRFIFPGLDQSAAKGRLDVLLKRGLLEKVDNEEEKTTLIKFTSD